MSTRRLQTKRPSIDEVGARNETSKGVTMTVNTSATAVDMSNDDASFDVRGSMMNHGLFLVLEMVTMPRRASSLTAVDTDLLDKLLCLWIPACAFDQFVVADVFFSPA